MTINQANLNLECLDLYKSILQINENNIVAMSFQSWAIITSIKHTSFPKADSFISKHNFKRVICKIGIR